MRIVCLILAVCGIAHAGIIGPTSICSALEQNELVFIGRVLNVTPGQVRIGLPGVPITPNFATPQDVRVTFDVLESFKGSLTGQVTFNGLGAVHFSQYHTYIVYARSMGTPQQMTAGGLETTRMKPFDLAWLRGLQSAKGGTIYGSALMPPEISHSPLVSIKVTNRNGRTYSTALDSSNNYALTDVPAGDYTISASAPSGLSILPSGISADGPNATAGSDKDISPAPQRHIIVDGSKVVFSVKNRSCALIDWAVHYDSHIRGRVTDPSGAPAASVNVILIDRLYADQIARGRFSASFRTKTSADGTYDFPNLNPGEYIAAIHPYSPSTTDPYPPVFYPAQPYIWNVKALHLDAGTTLNGIDFVRTAPLQASTIHVQVNRNIGTPIEGARISIADPASSIALAATAVTNASGRADVQLFTDREYTLTASTPEHPQTPSLPQEEPVCAGPIEFLVKTDLTLTVTPDKPWDACRSAPRPSLPPSSAR